MSRANLLSDDRLPLAANSGQKKPRILGMARMNLAEGRGPHVYPCNPRHPRSKACRTCRQPYLRSSFLAIPVAARMAIAATERAKIKWQFSLALPVAPERV
jgi:hypothetical protein